jgi:hypothetical protein
LPRLPPYRRMPPYERAHEQGEEGMGMAQLSIAPLGGGTFRVDVSEGGSQSSHEVTVRPETVSSLGWSGTLEELIRRSFEFLLEREPKESILGSFDITMISRYFPEYEQAARNGFA